MSRFLRESLDDVVDTYCRTVDLGGFSRISLREKYNYDCIFWEQDGCSIYPERPLQCRSFPFWSSNLASRETWDTAAETCPGIGNGNRHSKRKIEAWLKKRLKEPCLFPEETGTCSHRG